MNCCSNTSIKNNIQETIKKYEKYTMKTTPKLFAENDTHYVRILDIYDGDTCTIALNLGNNIYKFSVRLKDIDTCELKSHSKQGLKNAFDARNRLFNLITKIVNFDNNMSRKQMCDILSNSQEVYIVVITTYGMDKYGRILVNMYDSTTYNGNDPLNKSFSQILLDEKLAYPYDGRTKLTEDEQTVYLQDKNVTEN